mmetsp:Transcript_20518/g.37277  ORF Transcript_20518/g.37277 Transcript_20518/m.37277 type:complete len:92 (+) Transcript_20518:47-322(+)
MMRDDSNTDSGQAVSIVLEDERYEANAKNISKEGVFVSFARNATGLDANHALNSAFILVRDAIKASVLPVLEVTGRKSGWRDIGQPVRVIC